jgi:hypothetical protein
MQTLKIQQKNTTFPHNTLYNNNIGNICQMVTISYNKTAYFANNIYNCINLQLFKCLQPVCNPFAIRLQRLQNICTLNFNITIYLSRLFAGLQKYLIDIYRSNIFFKYFFMVYFLCNFFYFL